MSKAVSLAECAVVWVELSTCEGSASLHVHPGHWAAFNNEQGSTTNNEPGRWTDVATAEGLRVLGHTKKGLAACSTIGSSNWDIISDIICKSIP